MIKFLIVDDDGLKARAIRETILEVCPNGVVLEVGNRQDALLRLKDEHFDLMVLDLKLPRYPKKEPEAGTGFSILEMASTGTITVPRHIIVMTAYEDVDAEFRTKVLSYGWTLARYDASSSEWQTTVAERVRHVASGHLRRGYGVDAAFLCALAAPELSAVLKLPYSWVKFNEPEDDSIYYRGELGSGPNLRSFVALAADQMGMPTSAALTVKVIEAFRPRLLLMSGVAAGKEGAPGDVLVASDTWDSGAGKLRGPESFQPAPTQAHADAQLLAIARQLSTLASTRSAIVDGWPSARSMKEMPSVQVGPVASGSAVVAHRPLLEALVGANRKLIGVEMEAHGVYRAVELSRAPRPRVLCAKGLCDYADAAKADDWQELAAVTSSRFLGLVVEEYFRPKMP